MKLLLLVFGLLGSVSQLSYAQWQGANPVYFNAGYVGVGTSNPTSNLHIQGNRAGLHLQNNSGTDWTYLRLQGSGTNQWDIAQYSNNDFLEFRPNGQDNNRIAFKLSGNVGIGTVSPTARLHLYDNPGWSSFNYGVSLLISGPRHNSIGMLDAGGSNPLALTNVYGSFTLSKMPAIGNTSTDPVSLMTVAPNGNVGIGGFPYNRLLVAGSASTEDPLFNVTNLIDQDFIVKVSAVGASVKRTIIGTSTLTRLSLGVGTNSSNEHLTIVNGGNVGIGTTSPNQKLTVSGTIYGKEVKVDLNVPGPDYVFDNSYSLQTLEQVKSYVEENKHLPEIPSAKEMEENGINLSEMNMLLLKKIEELTLHAIRQQEEIDKLKQAISKQ